MAPEDAPATKRDLREAVELLQESVRDIQTELLKAFLPLQEAEPTKGFGAGGSWQRSRIAHEHA
jgi:hypothetical protein